MENHTGQIFSLWIGKNSSQCAHHFYALQAQQFFDQAQDPTSHSSIWKMSNSHGDIKTPYALIMNTEIPHLTHLRKINHKKMLKQMDKKVLGLQQMYFPISYKKEQQQIKGEQDQQDSYLYQNWESRQQNYIIIDKNYNQQNQSYQFWQQMYKNEADNYQDRIRKKLQYFDYLQCITLLSDRQKSGFSFQVVQHLKDTCSKKQLFYLDLNSNLIEEGERKIDSNWIAAQSQISPMTDIYCTINNEKLQHQYFQTNKFPIKLAPLINCMFTPFFLKNSNSTSYVNSLIANPRKNLFNISFTLPIISQKMELSQDTNIFKYLSAKIEQKKRPKLKQQSKKLQKLKQQKMNESQQQKHQQLNHLNYSFDFFAYDRIKAKKQKCILAQNLLYNSEGLICESYILKGHFHQLQNHFQPRTKLLSMKYLQGIFCNYKNQVHYDAFYEKQYGQKVQNFPFHTVMFQHQQFGPFLRNAAKDKNFKINHQMFSEWRQMILEQADIYKQIKNEDFD